MPGRDLRVRRRRRRTTYGRRPRRRGRRKTLTRYRGLKDPVPPKMIVKHKYVCQGIVNLSASNWTQNVILRANDMFDPEYATGGHQPFYFDQMAALYNHYTVVGSKLKIKFYQDRDDAQDCDPTYVALQLKDSEQSPLDALNVREQPGCKYTTMARPQTPHTLTKGFSAKRFFGKSKGNVVGESELRGTPVSGPSENAFWIITFTDVEAFADGETDTIQNVHWEAEILYTAVWTERKSILTS